jgi:hypothetical protein
MSHAESVLPNLNQTDLRFADFRLALLFEATFTWR